MQEKKRIVLALPTVIIIIIFIITTSYIFYNRNYKYMNKPLDRKKALELAQKVLEVDDLSCHVITKKMTRIQLLITNVKII